VALNRENIYLRTEIHGLRVSNSAFAERIAKQSELLSKRAERNQDAS
jgi:hypothetical protein